MHHSDGASRRRTRNTRFRARRADHSCLDDGKRPEMPQLQSILPYH